jgi:hypothetical protein
MPFNITQLAVVTQGEASTIRRSQRRCRENSLGKGPLTTTAGAVGWFLCKILCGVAHWGQYRHQNVFKKRLPRDRLGT